jgi:hypothetical protein
MERVRQLLCTPISHPFVGPSKRRQNSGYDSGGDGRTMRVRFRAKVGLRGVNPYVLVRPDRARRLRQDWLRPMPLRVRINGEPEVPWTTNMIPAGDGSFFLYLNGVMRTASRTAVGDVLEVELEFDPDYRGGPLQPMPPELVEGLDRSPRARKGWQALTPARQKEVVRYIAGLKSLEARRRNVEKAVEVLAGGNLRFLGREWNPPS